MLAKLPLRKVPPPRTMPETWFGKIKLSLKPHQKPHDHYIYISESEAYILTVLYALIMHPELSVLYVYSLMNVCKYVCMYVCMYVCKEGRKEDSLPGISSSVIWLPLSMD